ncbi:MAG: hypothetical protein QM660_08780 [Dysgonomonas sp.]
MKKKTQVINITDYPFFNFRPDSKVAYTAYILNGTPYMNYSRRAGNTTLLIDSYIQLLMRGAEIEIADHYNSENAHLYLINRLLDRIKIEHSPITILCDKVNRRMKIKTGEENKEEFKNYIQFSY